MMAMGAGRQEVGLHVAQVNELHQALSPLAIQVLRLLSLSQADIDVVVAAGVSANPILSAGPPVRCRWCAERLRFGRCPRCTGNAPLADEPAALVGPVERLRRESRLLVPARLRPAVELVIDDLDGSGLLRTERDELAHAVGVSPADLNAAIEAVRAAGPAGVAAANPRECLMEQARWHVDHGGPPLLVSIVKDHLSQVADGDHQQIALSLNASVGDVDAAVSFLRARMRPSAFAGNVEVLSPAPPDVIVRRADGDRLVVEVLGAADLGLELDREFVDSAVTGEAADWLAAQVADARSLVEMVDRRAAALRRVANGAVQVQREFVLSGRRAHVPLTRTALARALELHPSTVSRAVRGTVVALPDQQVIPLAAFFGGAVSVRECLAELLSSDDPPGSDSEACRRLALAGYYVARRTVAKYRLALQASGRTDGSPLRIRPT